MCDPVSRAVHFWIKSIAAYAMALLICGQAWAGIDGLNWEETEIVDVGVEVDSSAAGPVGTQIPYGNPLGIPAIYAIAYVKDGDIYACARDDVAWATPMRVSDDPAASRDPQIAFDGALVHVVWEDERHGHPEVFTRRWDGVNWSPEECLTLDDIPSSQPVIDGGYEAYEAPPAAAVVAWVEGAMSPGTLLARWWDGSGWGAVEGVVTDQPTVLEAAVAMGSGFWPEVCRDCAVTWSDVRHGESEIYLRPRLGGVWGDPTRLTDMPGNCRNPSIANTSVWGWEQSDFPTDVVFENDQTGVPEVRCTRDPSAMISADDGIASSRPSIVSYCISISDPFSRRGELQCLITWADQTTPGIATHRVRSANYWELGGEDVLSTAGLAWPDVSCDVDGGIVRIITCWAEQQDAQGVLMAGRGWGHTAYNGNAPASWFSLDTPVLLAPLGSPADTFRAGNDYGPFSPPAGPTRLRFDLTLDHHLTWDPLQQHPITQAEFSDFATMATALPVRGGGCCPEGHVYVIFRGSTVDSVVGATSPDIDGDCAVGDDDRDYVISMLGTEDFCADLDGSGLVDLADVAIVDATVGDHFDCPEEPCRVHPLHLNFGGVVLGGYLDRSFSITNEGSELLSGSVTEHCDEYSIISGGGAYTLQAGESLLVWVRFEPTALGTKTCGIATGTSCRAVWCSGSGALPCHVNPTSLDFGTVWLGAYLEQTFTIANIGEETVSGNVNEECSEYYIVSGGGAFSLAPGESLWVIVRFEPTSSGTKTCAIATGTSCDTVWCTGVGAPSCKVSPTSLDFGYVYEGEFSERTFTVTNIGRAVLSGTVSEYDPDYSIFSGSGPFSLLPGESLQVVVRFEPVRIGPATCRILTGTYCEAVWCRGYGASPCRIDPPAMEFGGVVVGLDLDYPFTITNIGGGTLAGAVSVPCTEFSIVGDSTYSLGPGEADTFTVRFAPISEGDKACIAETGADLCDDLPCTGFGASPCQIDPGILSFGDVAVGNHKDMSFTIANLGADALVGSVSDSCLEYEVVSGGGPYSLATGESLRVTVRLTPTSRGSKICYVEAGSSCGAVMCRGNGVEYECGVVPSNLDFGTVGLGDYRDTAFTITNTWGPEISGSVSASCADFSIVSGGGDYTLGYGESLVVTVRFEPTPACSASSCFVETGWECDSVTCTGRTTPWADATCGDLADSVSSRGASWGDYDGDGDDDLYVASNGSNRLYRNDGAGVFIDVTVDSLGDPGDSWGAVWGDYDGDNDLDLYIANYGTPNRLLMNDGGVFLDVTGTGPLAGTSDCRSVSWADYDNDGDLDLYLVNAGPNMLLGNMGGGLFTDATSGAIGDAGGGWGQAWGDYDDDGDQDVYICNSSGYSKLLRNDGDGLFADVTGGGLVVTGNCRSAAWGDFDNDGDIDLYVTRAGSANKLLRNDGNGVFTDVTTGPLGYTGSGRGVVWGDYENDGDLDLYAADYGGANLLLRNDGAGVFVDVSEAPIDDGGSSMGVAQTDCDGDGDLDIYLASCDWSSKLFGNHTDVCAPNWLEVTLIGTVSNTSGIGARVRICSGGQSQIREVCGGSGLGSQNSLVCHFGLGSAGVADTVEVRWPSGIVQVSAGVAANQVLTVVEHDDQGGVGPRTEREVSGGVCEVTPNPSGGTVTIRYYLAGSETVDLSVYDLMGREVCRLVRQETQPLGAHTYIWEGRNSQGRPVAPGLYFCRLQTTGYAKNARVMLVR